MSSSMNLAITIFGFVLSALFLMVICCRLLCTRSRQHGNPLDLFQIDSARSLVERSIHGMEPSVVTCFPTIKYNQHIFTSSEDNLCTICLSDYKEKEVLRILPKCGHAFHIACIDLWLRQHHTCPVCRISLQIFSEWRQTAGPYISLVAKSRFVPGALPDYLFEQPKNHRGISHGAATGISKNSPACTVVAVNVGGPVVGGSSSLMLQEAQGLATNELQLGERQQQPFEHRVTVELDALPHHQEPPLSFNVHSIPPDGSVPCGSKDDTIREDGVSHTNAAEAGAQAGASTCAHIL